MVAMRAALNDSITELHGSEYDERELKACYVIKAC